MFDWILSTHGIVVIIGTLMLTYGVWRLVPLPDPARPTTDVVPSVAHDVYTDQCVRIEDRRNRNRWLVPTLLIGGVGLLIFSFNLPHPTWLNSVGIIAFALCSGLAIDVWQRYEAESDEGTRTIDRSMLFELLVAASFLIGGVVLQFF